MTGVGAVENNVGLSFSESRIERRLLEAHADSRVENFESGCKCVMRCGRKVPSGLKRKALLATVATVTVTANGCSVPRS